MKNNMKKLSRFFAVTVLTISFCIILYYVVDQVFNGSFVDWFTRNYMMSYSGYDEVLERDMITSEPNWSKIKVLIITIFTILILIIVLLVTVVSHIYAKKVVKDAVREISNTTERFIRSDEDDNVSFPANYVEIENKMMQVKAIMQKHEHIIKEEAMRKNDLITYLAHDLRTPLTSVIGYLSLLEEAVDMPAVQRERYIRIAMEKAERLEKLINEFFEITRYNLQSISIEKENIDLYYMLVQMTDEFYPLLASKGKQAVIHGDEDITVHGDPVKLARVFNNILKNAIAYSDDNTTIQITAEVDQNEILLTFQNEGQTIPKEKLSAIFEKFFRMDAARTTNSGGAGLGLAIAKEIVTLHGGSITAESVDGITTFIVRLPA